jgi:hypothetical protein
MADIVMASCERGAEYREGEYYIFNSMWGAEDAGSEPYSQCIEVYKSDPAEVNMKWTWNWPVGGGHVKCYPGIRYGYSPQRTFTTTPHLPVQLSRIGHYIVNYDTTITATPDADYNTSFDLWLTSNNPPTQAGVTTEIMIWINNPNWGICRTDGRIIIDGQEYIYLVDERENRYIGFQKVNPVSIGTINIDHFLRFLIWAGLISVNDYLAEIAFGNEVRHGVGETTITRYSIEYQDVNMLLELQNLLTEILTQLSVLHTQSDAEAAKILAAQQAKAQADASIVIYDQVKTKCQEMIALLTP